MQKFAYYQFLNGDTTAILHFEIFVIQLIAVFPLQYIWHYCGVRNRKKNKITPFGCI